MPALALADRMFLFGDVAETPQHVAALGVFAVPPPASPEYVSDLAERFRAERTFASPFNFRLRHVALRKVAPEWRRLDDAEIDLDYHFHHAALPYPGGERELGVLVSRLHSQPLDLARPPWEVHLIEGLEGGRFALYMKVHHALMDGIGGIRRFQRMITTDPSDHELRPLWSIASRKPRSLIPGGIGRQLAQVSSTVWEGVGAAQGLAAAAGDLVREGARHRDPEFGVPFRAPSSVLGGRISRHRRIATQTFEFERIRALARSESVSINDVFLTICSAALERYLSELDELPERSLTAGTPVSIRVAGDDQTSNAFSMMIVKLATGALDPRRRLRAISTSSIAARAKLERLPRRGVELYAGLFMFPFLVQNVVGLGGRLPPPYNVVVSNVPGPLEQQYLAGAPLEALYPFGVLYHGVALFIGAFATSGTFGVGFCGCRDTLPHMQRLAVYAGEALDELEAAARTGTEVRA
jgi:diacylglycerol O-acyltransferase